ncbi:hypothetical protein [Clostridium culturomicium]|uniref:hypothetical protein n=1 Tax=Clostridium culturomicium TaxID=1499683 RepID=UPI000590064D|nr:hypothetical protein [Clostridium culturomicium]
MIFFKNTEIEATKKTTIKNEVGQLVATYVKTGILYKVNLQPIDIQAIKKTWGEDIESKFQIYADELLGVGDIILINSKSYEIEKHIPWNSYNIYAIKDVEVIINA